MAGEGTGKRVKGARGTFTRALDHPTLTAAEERELARRIERGDLAAKDRLVAHNLRRVWKIARKSSGWDDPALSREDLFQEGTVALVRAAEKFDYRRGVRFGTLAERYIENAVKRALSTKARQVRPPEAVVQRHLRIARAAAALEAARRPISDDAVAALAEVSVEDVREFRERPRAHVSMDALRAYDDGGVTLHNLLDAGLPGDPAADVTVDGALSSAPDVEQRVLALRWGLDGDLPASIEDTAAAVGLDPGEVRRVEARAIARVRAKVGGET